ncbi:MAG TPA: carboxypeptidase regulatory-like domain-containing protein [Pyrinomonadaceae bacterium]|nr:carboxypeptidase regulatory-like domain-containing protein [Pyrinomonadaceae bacterium]
MGFTTKTKQYFAPVFLLLIAVSATVAAAPISNSTNITIENKSGLGTIKGVVRDAGGSPIADATVAIFRTGTSKLLKQVNSSRDGSFLARILPGTYTLLAVAQGFNPVTLLGVEVPRATEVNYGFKLERSGSGNTLPEKRLDRNSSKWRIRASQSQRSIYQNQEGKDPVVEAETTADADDPSDEAPTKRRGQTVIETYFAGSRSGNSVGVNFATLVPVSQDMEIVFAGQVGKGKNTPQRFETALKFRAADDHQIRVNGAMARLGNFTVGLDDKVLGQLSFQASDEWKIRDGVILVLGFDYSRFTGAGSDSSLTPRLGLQYDINAKTRFQTAYTAQTEQKTWANALDLEGMSVGFTEPVSVDDLVVAGRKPMMNKSRRFEFGIERILDNRSSIEANVFFDTTLGRGVGLNSFSFDTLGEDGLGDFVANQQGRASGVRVVYSRRINGVFSTAAGYSFGNGQKLSESAISDPANAFESDFFNSFFAQLVADLKTGTNVKTIFRLSPQATVFAIDPFRGRLAIYDPGLSVLVTQSLPTLGLPIRAQAIVDARNLFDFQAGVFGEEGGLKLNSQGRMFRGGIQVRF